MFSYYESVLTDLRIEKWRLKRELKELEYENEAYLQEMERRRSMPDPNIEKKDNYRKFEAQQKLALEDSLAKWMQRNQHVYEQFVESVVRTKDGKINLPLFNVMVRKAEDAVVRNFTYNFNSGVFFSDSRFLAIKDGEFCKVNPLDPQCSEFYFLMRLRNPDGSVSYTPVNQFADNMKVIKNSSPTVFSVEDIVKYNKFAADYILSFFEDNPDQNIRKRFTNGICINVPKDAIYEDHLKNKIYAVGVSHPIDIVKTERNSLCRLLAHIASDKHLPITRENFVSYVLSKDVYRYFFNMNEAVTKHFQADPLFIQICKYSGIRLYPGLDFKREVFTKDEVRFLAERVNALPKIPSGPSFVAISSVYWKLKELFENPFIVNEKGIKMDGPAEYARVNAKDYSLYLLCILNAVKSPSNIHVEAQIYKNLCQIRKTVPKRFETYNQLKDAMSEEIKKMASEPFISYMGYSSADVWKLFAMQEAILKIPEVYETFRALDFIVKFPDTEGSAFTTLRALNPKEEKNIIDVLKVSSLRADHTRDSNALNRIGANLPKAIEKISEMRRYCGITLCTDRNGRPLYGDVRNYITRFAAPAQVPEQEPGSCCKHNRIVINTEKDFTDFQCHYWNDLKKSVQSAYKKIFDSPRRLSSTIVDINRFSEKRYGRQLGQYSDIENFCKSVLSVYSYLPEVKVAKKMFAPQRINARNIVDLGNIITQTNPVVKREPVKLNQLKVSQGTSANQGTSKIRTLKLNPINTNGFYK